MRDDDDDEQQLKIELLSQWKLEAEFRNSRLQQSHDCHSVVAINQNGVKIWINVVS